MSFEERRASTIKAPPLRERAPATYFMQLWRRFLVWVSFAVLGVIFAVGAVANKDVQPLRRTCHQSLGYAVK